MSCRTVMPHPGGLAGAIALCLGLCAAPVSGQTISLERDDFAPGEAMIVRYTHPGYQANGWIGLFPASAPHGDGGSSKGYLTYDNLGNVRESSMRFRAPDVAGRYELRMFTAAYGDEALVVGFTVGMGSQAAARGRGGEQGSAVSLPALPEAERRRILSALGWSGRGEPWVWAGYSGDIFEFEVRGDARAWTSLLAVCEAGCSLQTAVGESGGGVLAEGAPGTRVDARYEMPSEGRALVRVGIVDCAYDRCAFYVDGVDGAVEEAAGAGLGYAGPWNTQYGRIDLQGTTTLRGNYDGSSRVVLTPTPSGLEGWWIQASSGQRCSREVEGSAYWGRLVLTARPDGSLAGLWGYCDAQPNSAWDFRR